jgi:replicative DNA helicase
MSEAYPHSPTAEESLLHCVLLDPEIMSSLDVQPEDFYIERNRMIWQAIADLRMAGSTADYVTVCSRLDQKGQLQQIGGAPRITQIIATHDVFIFNADSYAKILRAKSMRRRMLDMSKNLAQLSGSDDDKHLESGIARVMDTLATIARPDKGAVHLSTFVSEVYDDVEEAHKHPPQNGVFGIPTGLTDFDRISGGLQLGETLKLAGEPGIGKSALAMQLVTGAAKAGYPGAVFALEMRGRNLARRMIAAAAGVPVYDMKTGRMNDTQWTHFTNGIDVISKLPIYISDSSQWTTASMRAELSRLIANYDIEWCVLDYEGLLLDDPDKDETTRTKLISSRVHGMFKDLNVAGLVVDDMNKSGFENGGTSSAGKASLSGSARKVYDADAIVFMRKHREIAEWVTLTWEKNREGDPNQFMDLKRTKGYPAFEETTTRER